jgi:hypothetical protein
MNRKASKWCRIVQNEMFRRCMYSVSSLVFMCVVILMFFAVDANFSGSNVAPEGRGYSVPLDRLGIGGITGSEGEIPLWCPFLTADHKNIESSMFSARDLNWLHHVQV